MEVLWKNFFYQSFYYFLFLLISKGHIEEITAPKPIRSNKEKTVFITGFPTDFETVISYILENDYDWNVAIINNNGTDSFSIECRSLYYRDFKGYEGIVQFTDLRTGKRIGYYEFSSEKFDNIIINILDYMNYISEN